MDEAILVTGGAGYIGTALVKALCDSGHAVVVVDNLSNGRREKVDERAKFFELDLKDMEKLDRIFSENNMIAVVHLAAYTDVVESMTDREKYIDNITGTKNLVGIMAKHGVKKMIFSSSAAVYGDAEKIPVDETASLKPLSFYAKTKIECEEIIKENISEHIIFRYFNVAGDYGLKFQKENDAVFSSLVRALSSKEKEFTIYGKDYRTKDGTCVRDYIDIRDLVRAHMLAIDSNFKGILNLGSANGVTVKELADTFSSVSGKHIICRYGPRRKGDIAISVASNSKAARFLGWKAEISLKDTVRSVLHC